MKKQNKIMVKFYQCGSLLNKYVMTIETNSQWKYQIKIVNDKQIHDVVAVEAHVNVLPFGVVLAYAIAPNSPIPTDGLIITNGCDVKFKWKIALDNYKYVTK